MLDKDFAAVRSDCFTDHLVAPPGVGFAVPWRFRGMVQGQL
jgi:hypothetical protein